MITHFPVKKSSTKELTERSRRIVRSNRGAFTVIELTVSIFLLCTCMIVFSQFRFMLIDQQRRMDTRNIAYLQLQNIWEILGSVPDEKILSGEFEKEPLESLIAHSLPDGKLEFKIVPLVFQKTKEDSADQGDKQTSEKEGASVILHRVQAIVSWDDGAQRPRRSMVLSRLFP